MKTLEHKLRMEQTQLREVVREVERRLRNAPKGQLRISKKRKGVEFYYKETVGSKEGKKNNGKYIKKEEYKLAEQLAQRDYDRCVLKNAEERIKGIEVFLEKYKHTRLETVYQETNAYRKKLINPIVLSDEEYVKLWQAAEYRGKGFDDLQKEIITERGERVRSKSEKIIADKLYALSIPYRYECPLDLDGNIRVYPDFTILKLPEREEMYLEHFGMMDDADYVNSAMNKLRTYEKNRIYLGVNLFVTHETSKNPLNIRALDGLLRSLFCDE